MAYNVNLNTTSTRRANAIAFDIREAGRLLRENNNPGGALLKDENGEPIRKNGLFKHVKGIGWYIEELWRGPDFIQLDQHQRISTSRCLSKTCEKAQARGLRVTGSELVGLVPKNANTSWYPFLEKTATIHWNFRKRNYEDCYQIARAG